MLSRRADGSVLVQVPHPAQDRPSWKRVAVIAAIGFVVGIVWPHFAGVRLGPSLPEASSVAAGGSAAATQQAPSLIPPLVAGPPVATSSATSPTPLARPHPMASAPPPVSSVSSSEGAPRGVVAKPSDSTNGGSSSAGAASTHSSVDAADGAAQVVWEVAIVRDAPKTGKIVARLQRGSPLRVGPVKDGWYPVRYGEGFAGDGWVFRGAIGR